ncbi:MAG: hypothetical protein RL033_2623 [Pseudomonadota bacterium]|jgi:hypothetical protein
MQRLLGSLGLLGSGVLLVVACSADASENFFGNPDADALAGLGGRGGAGSSGSGGGGGSAGTGSAGAGGVAGAGVAGSSPDAGPGPGDAGCSSDAECDDQNACTLDHCDGGACVTIGFAVLGATCGSALNDECTDPDTCDGSGNCQPNNTGAQGIACGSSADSECSNPDTCDAQGVCQPNDEVVGTSCGSSTADECTNADGCDDNGQCSPNHVAAGTSCGNTNDDECANPDVCGNGVCLPNDVANGSACTDGSCAVGLCVTGQPVGCPTDVAGTVPFTTSWSSVGKPDLYVSACDSANMPDYALIFTAPETATFRFAASALVDSTPYTGADQSEPFTSPPDGDAVLTIVEGGCAGGAATQVDCNDDVAEGNPDSQLELALTQGQVVTVYLNELTQSGGGTGTLTITQVP